MRPLAVLGAGSWGTAVAILLAHNGHRSLLWGRDAAQLEQIAKTRRNAAYLGTVALPAGITPCADLDSVLRQARDLFIAVPSAAFPAFVAGLRGRLRPDARLVSLTKGLELETADTLDSVVARCLGDTIEQAVVSGPTFAREVARGLPTAVTVAARPAAFAETVAGWLHGVQLRAYTSDDLLGVELGGALKNVLAIAVGIADGLGMGANARAALITRGLAELSRLYHAAGARTETLMGLSGLGDLVLTCTDDQSRNRRLGLALGRGSTLEMALDEIGQAVEGATTARSVMRLAQRYAVELPICEWVHRVLYEGVAAREAVAQLLAREPKAEAATFGL
ncbi:glycerol-3-phosphate dehydrogenase [Acidihalobacter ferrooxydans]|uniref:Glycerol-3-phosphate dehydrogenase [NAD(P)+] n=1 Tax=Acidihalobacter ferrooxydans TaxID=1765967 RepID=A0A1P8UKR6_9GAMM|nr:glycerol-3-phosphate dehydrogenase [Acidihalobacter ferrooxydans]